MGEIAGDAMATAVTLIDGLIVIGGGITGARKWIMPSLLKELRSKMHTIAGDEAEPRADEGLRSGQRRGVPRSSPKAISAR